MTRRKGATRKKPLRSEWICTHNPALTESILRPNDSHLHLIRGGLNYNLELRWEGVPSLADAFSRFEEEGVFNPHTGKAFRQAILARGGSKAPMELSVFLTIRDRSEACLDPAVMRAVETFDFKMREVPGVQSVQSVAGMSKQ